jgi:lysophospholipase L1-like esterase
VINAGAWGYTSFQGLRWLEQSLAFQPDLVLVSFGSNDALAVAMTDAQYARRLQATGTIGRSRLGQLILRAWDAVTFSRAPDAVTRVPTDDYVANLRAFIRLGEAHGFDVVLLTRPFIGPIPSLQSGNLQDMGGLWKRDGRRNNRATMQLAEDEGVAAVDVYEAFVNRPELFADESHFTEEGHRLAARLIDERIASLIDRARGRASTAP